MDVYNEDLTLLYKVATNGNVSCPPAIADLNNDGKLEIICFTASGYLEVFDAKTGEKNISLSYPDRLSWSWSMERTRQGCFPLCLGGYDELVLACSCHVGIFLYSGNG